MEKFLFLTGMFRSGTTLLATMLSAHPRISVSSDPYLPIFKRFRDRVARDFFPQAQIPSSAPLDDYYFYPEKQALMKRIQETSLDLSFSQDGLSTLRNEIATYSAEYSPKLGSLLGKVTGHTFTEVIDSGLDIIRMAYGNSDTEWVGFKLVWTDEFAGHILKRFPKAKVIHIVRDPRATCASKNVTDAKYPWLFLIRQWRKSVTFAWSNCLGPSPWHGRVLLVKYEELVSNPERVTRAICSFLGVEFSSRLVAPECFTGGADEPWIPNTSYSSERQQAFNIRSIDNWKSVLKTTEVQLIERLCFPEMRAFGYECVEADSPYVPPSLVFNPPVIPEHELASWIQPHASHDLRHILHDMALEHWRGSMVSGSEPVDDTLKSAISLDAAFFDRTRQLMRQR